MVTMGFDVVSLQKYGQSSYEHCYVHQWGVLLGVFRNVPNSRAVVTLFGGDWLLLILMMVSTQGDVKLII